MKRLTWLFALVLAAGCGGAADSEFLDSAPETDALLAEATGDAASEGLGTSSSALTQGDLGSGKDALDATPEYLAHARAQIKALNDYVRATLEPVSELLKNPPEMATKEVHVWGPEDRGSATYKFTMKKFADKKFGWKLEGKPQGADDSAYKVVMAGAIARNAEARRGRGVVGIDGDAFASVDPAIKSQGRMLMGFFHGPSGARSLNYALREFTPDKDLQGPVSAAFNAVRGPLGRRVVRLVARANVDPTATAAKELVVARITWIPQVGGRFDAIATQGDIPVNHAYVGKGCWNAVLQEGYKFVCDVDRTLNPPGCVQTLIQVGDPSVCGMGLGADRPPKEDPNASDSDAASEGLDNVMPPDAMPDGSGQGG